MICHQLHTTDKDRTDTGSSFCTQDIPELNNEPWKFCPRCGRSTGHLVVRQDDCRVGVPENEGAEISVPVWNEGFTPVKISYGITSTVPGLAIWGNNTDEVQRDYPAHIKIDVPLLDFSGRSEVHLGVLEIEATDGEVTAHNDPWAPVATRTRKVSVHIWAIKRRPPSVRFVEEVAIFHSNLLERRLTLENQGDGNIEIVLESPSPGYTITRETTARYISGGQTVTYRAVRDNRTQAAARTTFSVHFNSGASCQVDLLNRRGGRGGLLYMGVVGIDFGTTFTTVTFRECRHTDTYSDDPVRFLRPMGETEDRFPTLAWIDASTQEIVFGTQAEERYNGDPTAGYLIREFKTLLRDPDNVKIDGNTARDRTTVREEGIALLRSHLGAQWAEELVVNYLTWLNTHCIKPALDLYLGAGADVQYIFSIPVLDYNLTDQSLYNTQSQKMRECIERAGFPLFEDSNKNRVEIEFEPVCAMIGLLHPPADVEVDTQGGLNRQNKWPKLNTAGYPLKNDDLISIYDSGGGTTDVVVAKASIGEDGRIMLRPLGSLGVGNKAETFGGEWVTDRVFDALIDPTRTVVDANGAFDTTWYQGTTADFSNITRDIYDNSIKPDRTKAKQVKFELANDKPVSFVTPPNDTPGTVNKRLLALLILNELKSICEKLKDTIFKSVEREKVPWYLFVGGNTRIPFLRQFIERYMLDQHGKRSLLLPDRYQQLAISYGAVWVPDARVRNAVPYDVRVVLRSQENEEIKNEEIKNEESKDVEILSLPRFQSRDIFERRFLYQLGPYEHVDVCVLGGFQELPDNPWVTLARTRMVNIEGATNNYRGVASLHGGEIEIQWGLNAGGNSSVETILRYLL